MSRPSSVCVFLLWCIALVEVTLAASQTPRPHNPNAPLQYPDDYCEKITDKDEFDYIVVGAGPAGSAVSRRLAEDAKVKVLLMEAGDDPISLSDLPIGRGVTPNELWTLKTEGSDRQCGGFPGKSCKYVLGKFLGGASVVNLMMYSRGNPKDFDEWGSKPGCTGWGWKDMYHYFLKLENYQDPLHLSHPDFGYHHRGGPFTTSPSQIDPQSHEFKEALQQSLIKLGVPHNRDFNGKSRIGVGSVTGLLAENGYRNNVAKAYLLDLPKNMKVCKKALVNRVVFKGKTATGVEYSYNGGAVKTVKVKKDVVISGGALNTPQLLERSGIGNATILKNVGVDVVQDLPGVGENIQEQFTNLGCAFQIDFKTASARNPLSIALTSFTMFLNMTDYKNEVPDLQWLFVPFDQAYMGFSPEIAAQYTAAGAGDNFVLMAGSEILRQSQTGYVHITGTDPTKTPDYNPMQYTSKEESKLTTQGCQLIRKAMKNENVKKFNPRPIVLEECKKHKFNTEDEIMCQARLVGYPAYHMAGGAVMGSDKRAVVDNKLVVHGLKKLRVCDTSIMPGVPRGNTEVPSIAIGEKCADVIKKNP